MEFNEQWTPMAKLRVCHSREKLGLKIPAPLVGLAFGCPEIH